jgi:hypothetical protein
MKRRHLHLVFVTLVLSFLSCDRKPSGSSQIQDDQLVQAKLFEREVYRSVDGNTAIILTSPEELELTQNGTNLVCKYTMDGDTFRVVANILGTTQALYYRMTAQGLKANDGKVLDHRNWTPIYYAFFTSYRDNETTRVTNLAIAEALEAGADIKQAFQHEHAGQLKYQINDAIKKAPAEKSKRVKKLLDKSGVDYE